MSDKHICQVAFSALNGPALRQWYAEVFGFVKSGRILFFPPSTSRVQGIPGAWEKCSWLIDQQDYFQLEFFQFWTPRSALKPDNWRPSDIGYNLMGIAVNDFDQVLRKVSALSAIETPQVVGEAGNRRACVVDPEGNLVEVFECDPLTSIDDTDIALPRPEVPAVVRTMRASVPNLEDARQAFVDAMGLQEVADFQLHSQEDEALWGLPGARAKYLLLRGANFLLELVEYSSPAPRPWSANYSIADQGYMNIAFGYRDPHDYDRSFEHAVNRGMTANGKVLDAGIFRVMYVNDPHGFSVEMLYARKAFWSISGFNAREPYVATEIDINAPVEQVWRRMTDHARMGDWTPFTGRILRAGRPEHNGTGCLRELSAPALRITEEVTAWEEDSRYSYRLRAGAPFRKLQGDVYLVDESGRTRVRWALRFDCWIPFSGAVVAGLSGFLLRRSLRKLKSQLEAQNG